MEGSTDNAAAETDLEPTLLADQRPRGLRVDPLG